MAKYDHVGNVYRKRKESAWPAIAVVVMIIVIIAAVSG